MKKGLGILCAAVLTVWCMTAPAAKRDYRQRGIDPLVSTEWLAKHLNDSGLVIVDIRGAKDYASGHIPRAGNFPAEKWWVTRNRLLLELPDPEALRDLIGRAGISADSKVVLVNNIDTEFARSHLPCVAWTLIYGGVKSVAILDGGYKKWTSEGRDVAGEPYIPPAKAYTGTFQERVLALKSDVERCLLNPQQVAIVDSRTPEDFFGISPLMLSPKSGHIPGAVCLPAPWAFTAEGAFRKFEDLEAMAHGAVGPNPEKHIIVYCGVGGFASTWWFIFSEMLGYDNVQLYNGSIQEWMMDAEAPVVKYQW
jgi:thiosulfate/3-mercaptopyruvate sulfurtransferase